VQINWQNSQIIGGLLSPNQLIECNFQAEAIDLSFDLDLQALTRLRYSWLDLHMSPRLAEIDAQDCSPTTEMYGCRAAISWVAAEPEVIR
jgi:hypothetical protein